MIAPTAVPIAARCSVFVVWFVSRTRQAELRHRAELQKDLIAKFSSAQEITEFLATPGPQSVVVRAEDDPADLSKPRGKQDWQLEPHGIWYPRTSGI